MQPINPPSPITYTTDSGEAIRSKTLTISAINCAATQQASVAHSLSDISKIRSINIFVLGDSSLEVIPFSGQADPNSFAPSGQYYTIDNTNINLRWQKYGNLQFTGYTSTAGIRFRIFITYIN